MTLTFSPALKRSTSILSGSLKTFPPISVIESPFLSTLWIVSVIAFAKAPVDEAIANIVAAMMTDLFIFLILFELVVSSGISPAPERQSRNGIALTSNGHARLERRQIQRKHAILQRDFLKHTDM
ncbi:hypothetical protein GGE67_001907 [Rhizobium leucaenae]|uniref:Uncharacterized protein n=1 Tax=Rhizobium leucaenae TaxID=29450 RepID=A0A7W7EJN4_9HYPH|nr:hypothetical protein [Rhizobium leucaenae]MBB4568036.1 hypothetical protein [Rhizobium leucaenae]MBB6301301.1 hypothetical protein [Rhizobium leucaenae]